MTTYWTAYDTIYNARPGEMEAKGHFGKVRPTSSYNNGEDSLESFLLRLKELSHDRHENANQSFGFDYGVYRPDWTKWVGQPKNKILNIRFQENKGEAHNPFMVEAGENINV